MNAEEIMGKLFGQQDEMSIGEQILSWRELCREMKAIPKTEKEDCDRIYNELPKKLPIQRIYSSENNASYEAVSIVRCKDCKFRNTSSCLGYKALFKKCKDCTYNQEGQCSGPFFVGLDDRCIVSLDDECFAVADDDFCSYGERR